MKNNFEKTVQNVVEDNYKYYNSYNCEISKEIQFKINKKFKKYVKKIFLYRNDYNQYVKTLKKILLLLIENKKHKNLVKSCYNTTDKYINNFKINDIEYNKLVECYKTN